MKGIWDEDHGFDTNALIDRVPRTMRLDTWFKYHDSGLSMLAGNSPLWGESKRNDNLDMSHMRSRGTSGGRSPGI